MDIKRRNRIKKRLEKGYYKDKLSYTMAKNSVYCKELKKKPTRAELIVFDYLKEEGIKFKFQKGFVKPFHRIVDFYLTGHKVILEVDGGYHNSIKEKDEYKDKLWLDKRGLKTIRITNEQVYNNEYQTILLLNNIF